MKINKTAIKIALIAIGDELLDGFTRDANAHWLAQFLFVNGAELTNIQVIRDVEAHLISALDAAYLHANIVITCGAIGPTLDDKTKQSVAHYFSQELINHEEATTVTINNYARRNREWVASQNSYNMFPAEFCALNNAAGFAPGLFYNNKKTQQMIFCLPGVPREFVTMMKEEVFPAIVKEYPSSLSPLLQTVIQTYGVPEEKIFFELCPTLWSELEEFGKVSSLPQTSGIEIIVSHYSADANEYKVNHKKILTLFDKSLISKNIWNIGKSTLAEVIVKEAIKNQVTFSFAESCTGGLVSSKITDVSGSSNVFLGSIISYTNKVKISSLNVSEATISKHTAVSLETAKEMALGVREKMNSTYGVSITGIAGPTGEMDGIPVGTVIIGMSTKEESLAREFHFFGDRKTLKDRFSETALLELWKLVTNKSVN